jgi:hypothetical protein
VKKNNTIEINGKRYDAFSGKLLPMTPIPHPAKKHLDGIIVPKGAPIKSQPENHPAPVTLKTENVKPKPVFDIAGPRVKPLKSHSPEPSKTLMRTVVAKPKPTLKRHANVSAAIVAIAPLKQQVLPKLSARRVDPVRKEHATQTARSQYVQHFSNKQTRFIPKNLAPIRAQPGLQPTTPRSEKPSLDIFERALAVATAHEELPVVPEKKRRLSRQLRTVIGVVAIIVIAGGILAYQNASNIKLYVASSKAGFQATAPGYHPSGFDLGALSYSPGTIAMNYHSNSDSRSYTLTEKSSNWDSSTLRDSFVSQVAGQNYETIEAAGRTVYVYGNNNATWVNGGIWYQVKSSGSLSTQQLIQLASSM